MLYKRLISLLPGNTNHKAKERGNIMPASKKTVISFGLVAIPIELHTATSENDISFNQLHRKDHSRIRYKKTCGHCGEEVKSEDIVKGYQYEKDQYVIVTDEEIEKIKTEKDKTIQIIHFANLNQISPVYYDRAYHLLPSAGGEKAFELLRESLMNEQKVAIGKTVMGSSEKLLVIIPREDGIIIQTMYFHDEVKDIPVKYQKPKVAVEELKLAQQLISSMDTPYDPAAYHDEYQEKLRGLIETKIAGKKVVAPRGGKVNNVIDMMEALKKSVEQNKSTTKSTPKKKTATAKSTATKTKKTG